MALNYKTGYHYRRYLLRLRSVYQQPVAKASLGLILTLLTISFFGLFAIRPTLITIAKLIKELKEAQKTNQILEKKVNNLTQAQFTYAAVEDYLAYVNRSLPKKAEFNRLATEINFLAFNHNLLLSSASFEEFELLELDNKLKTLKFRISVAGGFTDIKNFLKDLANLDRIVNIDSVAFSTKTEIAEAQVQANISAEAFWFSTLNKKTNEKEKSPE